MGAFSHPIFQIFVLGTSFNLLSEPAPPKDANLHYHHYLPQVAFLNLEHATIFTSCVTAVRPLVSVVLCSYRLYGFNFLTSLHELTFIPNSIPIQISWTASKKKEIFLNLFATLDFKRNILHDSTVLCFELIQMQARLFIYERQGKDRPLVTSHMIATVTTWEQRILQKLSCKS